MARRFRSVLAVEGELTGDGRLVAPNACTWETPPIPLLWQENTADGHDTAEVIGVIDMIERRGTSIYSEGHLLEEHPDRYRIEEMIRERVINPSIDPDDVVFEIDETDPENVVFVMTQARIRAATLVATQAIVSTTIDLIDEVPVVEVEQDAPSEAALVEVILADGAPATVPAVQLVASGAPSRPPAAWFQDPQLTGPTPLTVDDDGRVYGHLATWGTCFAGETEYLTAGGIRSLKETVGTTQRVLASAAGNDLALRRQREFGGVWVDAEIHSFGIQPLMKVTLQRHSQTKEVYATAGHRWLVTPRGKEGFRHCAREIVTTAELQADARLSPLFPKPVVTRGKGVRPSQFGVAHGFTFGDGTRHRDGCRVDLFGAKDEALLPYFAQSTSWRSENANGVPKVRIANLPAFFKERPSLHESLSYLYGWLAGYFAADGTVSAKGTAILFSASREHLEFVRDVCARLGIGTSSVSSFSRVGASGEDAPGVVRNDRVSVLHRITLIASTLTADFFIGEEHRERFCARPKTADPATAWHVVAVEETDRVEEVFCAVVPELENFTLAENINVMNCHTGFPNTCTTAPPSASEYAYFHTGEVLTADGERVATGRITVGGGHAAPGLGFRGAMAHYDDAGAAAADVVAGEDTWGIWLAGAMRAELPEATIQALRANPPSGDWRRISGSLELMGALCVNTPGFPIPRPRFAAKDGVQTSLVAAGALQPGGQVPTASASGPDEAVVAAVLSRLEQRESAERLAVSVGRDRAALAALLAADVQGV